MPPKSLDLQHDALRAEGIDDAAHLYHDGAPVLPEVRRGGKVVDPESLLRHEKRHDERLTGLPRRNTPRRSV